MSDINSTTHLKSCETKDSIKNPSKDYSENCLKDSTASYTSINDTSNSLVNQRELDPITTPKCGDTFKVCDKSSNIDEILNFSQQCTKNKDKSDHQDLKMLQNNPESVSYQEQDFDVHNEFCMDATSSLCNLPNQFANINTVPRANCTKRTRKNRKFKVHIRRKLNILLYFYDNNSNLIQRKHPKKGYFRTILIRTFMKFLRSNKVSQRYMSKEKAQEVAVRNSIHNLMAYCGRKSRFLSEIYFTNTHNDMEVKELFSVPEVLKAFKKYINTIFLEKDPSELAQMFGFYCCDSWILAHNLECYEKWRKLKCFSSSELIGINS
ncbi:hypothetical protein SteCoe_6686 [Stentor coeruleus]|uniref:Uncharacterized protein n=1 Tax=Stentor coeruleus TaxID=5963 RepID=A0A1R2CPM5_9CILI|nr:hypothetical protein SteCoe_6686 [Stentor coeruleus]